MIPPGCGKSGVESSGLPEIAAQPDDAQAGIIRRQGLGLGKGVVTAAVIDQNDLEGFPQGIDRP